MNTSTTNTESKTASTGLPTPTSNTGYATPPTPTPEPKVEDKVDDFGYEIDKPKEEVKPTPTPEAKPEDKPVEKPSTGYGKEDDKPKEEPKVDDKPKEEVKPDDEKIKSEISEVVKSLSDDFDKDKISKFALDNKFTKEQVEAYVNFVKTEAKTLEDANKAAIDKQKRDWKEELVKDPEFGGENFDKNVDRVEKVLQNYMPNLKKVLTERGTMLPPYIMRDFLALAKVLNPTTNLVGGEPSVPKKDEGNFLEEMYN